MDNIIKLKMSNVKPNRWSETDRRTEMKDFFSNKKKLRGYREFLYILWLAGGKISISDVR